MLIKERMPDIEITGEYKAAKDRIECRCSICNHVWEPLAYNLLSGFGCSNCKKSNSEKRIACLLDEWHISFEPQKRFEDCKDSFSLPFDFYIPQYRVAIEYDGEQHYMPVNWSGNMTDEELLKAFELVQKHDEIKTKYCEDNNIKLLRIPYWEKNNIEHILFNSLTKLNIIEKVS